MKKKEIEKFIKNNVIKRLKTDCFQKGCFIIFKPIGDIVGGFCFENSASGGNDIYIWQFADPLYIKGNIICLTFGDRLKNSDRGQLFNLDNLLLNPNAMAYLLNELNFKIDSIQKNSLPSEFYHYLKKEPFCKTNTRYFEALVYTSLWLRLPSCLGELNEFISFLNEKENLDLQWVSDILTRMIQLKQSNDPKQLLTQWKQLTLENLKLSHLVF